MSPLFRPAAHVHQHDTAFYFGHRLRHGGIPAQRGDIIHNLCADIDRSARNARLICVHRYHSLWPLRMQRLDHRDDPLVFHFLRHRRALSRARRLPADINDVGAFIQHLQRALQRLIV